MKASHLRAGMNRFKYLRIKFS